MRVLNAEHLLAATLPPAASPDAAYQQAVSVGKGLNTGFRVKVKVHCGLVLRSALRLTVMLTLVPVCPAL